MPSIEEVRKLVEAEVPDATVEVTDLTGTSDHFRISVVSPAFAGKSRIEQHKMIHSALREHLTTTIHAVEIKTGVPE